MKFYVKYVGNVLLSPLKCSALGGLLGLVSGCYFLYEELQSFAAKNHTAVDLQNKYVPDDEQFLHASKENIFNQVDVPISSFLPVYSTLVGASCGLICYGIYKLLPVSDSKRMSDELQTKTNDKSVVIMISSQ